jgi:hypothetical protein
LHSFASADWAGMAIALRGNPVIELSSLDHNTVTDDPEQRTER